MLLVNLRANQISWRPLWNKPYILFNLYIVEGHYVCFECNYANKYSLVIEIEAIDV